MSNNIAVGISVDVADLRAKRAIMSQELAEGEKSLKSFAKAAQETGTRQVSAEMLAAADAVSKTKAQIKLVDDQLVGHTAHVGNAREAYMGLRVVQSALTGDLTRAGAEMVHMSEHMIAHEHSASLLAAALSPLGLAIIGVTAATVAATVAGFQYEAEQRQLIATTVGLGAASGLTRDQLEQAGEAAAHFSGQSISASTASAEAFAAAGVRTQATIETLSGVVGIYAELTGEKAADAQKKLADAMRDPIKGAQDLNAQLGILDSTQLEQIRTMTEAGDKEGAVAILTKALKERTDEAAAAGVHMNSVFGTMAAKLSDVWTWLGNVTDAFARMSARMLSDRDMFGGGPSAGASAAAAKAQHQAQLNADSAGGLAVLSNTPEGRDRAAYDDLNARQVALGKALAADIELHGQNSEAVRQDRAALQDYDHAIQTYMGSAEKKHELAVLDARIAEAKHKHDRQAIQDLTDQRAVLARAGEVASANDVSQSAKDAGAVAMERTGGGHAKKGPDIVSEWAEQLHAAEITSNNFFSDQTEAELKFWQGKLALVTKGSKDWLAVQDHIYSAQKTLARQDYDDHIADLNDRLQADHDSWSKEQADWQAKLDYIKSKFGEESKEYKDAHREMEAAERSHAQEMEAAQKQARQRELSNLRQHLQTLRSLREEDARSTESVIQSEAGSKPIGEISAAMELARLHQQLNAQELADLESLYATEASQLANSVADAEAKYTTDSKQYQDALSAKAQADQQYQDQKAALEHRATAQSIQDILSVKNAYAGYINGVVSSTSSGLLGALSGTQTFGQAAKGVYSSVLSLVDQKLSQFVTNWLVSHIFMSAAQKAQLAAQVAAHTVSEAAKTTATATGATARATSEVAASTTAAVAEKAIVAQQAVALVGLAGAGGVASMAAAPFPIDLGAPAFGAAMAAAASGFAAVAQFDKGTNLLPNDMLAQVHAGERIVPAADNRQIISALNGNGVDQSRGDTHYHMNYSPELERNPSREWRSHAYAHGDVVLDIVRKAFRDGKLKRAA